MHSLRLSGPGVAKELLLCLLRLWPTGEYCRLLGTSERTASLTLHPNTSRPLTSKQLRVLLRWAGALSCPGSTPQHPALPPCGFGPGSRHSAKSQGFARGLCPGSGASACMVSPLKTLHDVGVVQQVPCATTGTQSSCCSSM